MANGSDKVSSGSEEKCPVMHGAMTRNSATGTANSDWWPEQLNLILWMLILTTEKSLKSLIILL